MSTTISELGDETAVRERLELIRRMADDLAHELKNPLNAVVINLELVRTRVRGGNADGALARIDVIEEELRRLHLLLDHTLKLMRTEPQTGSFELGPLLAEVSLLAGVLAKLARGRFTAGEIPDGLRLARGRESLRFALLWLVAAALAGAEEDGEVRLDLQPADGAVRLRLSSGSGRAASLAGSLPGARRLLEGSGALVGEVETSAGHASVVLTLAGGDGTEGITGR